MKNEAKTEFGVLFMRFTVTAIITLMVITAVAACITVAIRVDDNIYSVHKNHNYHEQHSQKESFYMNNM